MLRHSNLAKDSFQTKVDARIDSNGSYENGYAPPMRKSVAEA